MVCYATYYSTEAQYTFHCNGSLSLSDENECSGSDVQMLPSSSGSPLPYPCPYADRLQPDRPPSRTWHLSLRHRILPWPAPIVCQSTPSRWLHLPLIPSSQSSRVRFLSSPSYFLPLCIAGLPAKCVMQATPLVRVAICFYFSWMKPVVGSHPSIFSRWCTHLRVIICLVLSSKKCDILRNKIHINFKQIMKAPPR